MYLNAAEVPRPELSTFLEEAQGMEQNLFAHMVMPVYDSPRRTGEYPRIKIEKGELLRKEVTERAPRAAYKQVTRKTEWDNFACREYGLEELVDEVESREMQNFFQMEVLAAKFIRRAIMLDYETRVASKIMNPGTFTATNGAAAYTEGNLDNIEFDKDIFDALERMSERATIPNTMIMSQKIFNLIRRSTQLQTFMYGNLPDGNRRLIRPADLGEVFGIPNVFIAKAYYDDAESGQVMDLKNCWGDDYIALLDVQGGDFERGGVGRTIVWGADSEGGLYTSESYRESSTRGDCVRVRMHTDEKVINELCGELITTQHA